MRGIPRDEEFIKNLAFSIGYLATGFSLFEFSLNASIAAIYHNVGRPKDSKGLLPRNFKNRLNFLRDSVKELAALAPFKAEALGIVAEARRLAIVRNNVIHGYIADFDEATLTLTFVSIAPNKSMSMHDETRFAIVASELLEDGSAAVAMSAQMRDFAHRLMQTFVP